MFTELYLQTTNPKLTLSQFFSKNIMKGIIISIIFHTLVYTGFCNLVSYIFFGKLLSKLINLTFIP